MSKSKEPEVNELREEYQRNDLGTGIRGKYLRSYEEGSNLVLLSPDVAQAFPTNEAVNEALRSLIDHDPPRKSTGIKRPPTPRARNRR